MSTTRLFFATDIHGSTRCFKKFLNSASHYKADVIIVGGDLTGKSLVPVVRAGAGRHYAHDSGTPITLTSEGETMEFEARLADAGVYSYRCGPDEFQCLSRDVTHRNDVFSRLIRSRLEEWISLADVRLAGQQVRAFLNPGNDDTLDIDTIIDGSAALQRPEGRVVELDSHLTMISTGYANATPFHCPRDVSEQQLEERINDMIRVVPDVRRCVFNFHCPPFESQLDNAPMLDDQMQPRMTALGLENIAVGSTAVRVAIETHQPVLGLHGHIHESKGISRIGRTVCINPGSEYHEGILRGTIIHFEDGIMKHYALTCG